MVDAIERLIADLEAEEFQHGVHQRFWKVVERSGTLIYLCLYAPDSREYLMELECSSYGEEPILGRFVDPTTKHCVSSAWPRGDSTFAGWVKFEGTDLFICWPQDRGGIQRHPEWRQFTAWKNHHNQIFAYLDFIRTLLHVRARGYQRKAPDNPD